MKFEFKIDKKNISFKKAANIIKPNTTTLISGSFEPFNNYYLKLLKWSAKQNRPLTVIIQKNDMVLLRRGFLPLSSTHKDRVNIISALEFVDYVIVANKTAHSKECIKKIRPKIVVFQNDNIKYRQVIAREIKNEYPNITIKYAPRDNSKYKKPTDYIYNKSQLGTNRIIKRLTHLSSQSDGHFSKISALLTDNRGKIILESKNSAEDEHAEILLIKNAKAKKINLHKCLLYILIPPCLMCSRAISKCLIKNVYYIFPYGDDRGITYLSKRGIIVKHYKYKAFNNN